MPMQRWLLALLAGAALTPPLLLAAPDLAPAFRVVGYLPDYRATEFDPISARMLTDVIVFSAEPTKEGGLDLTRLKAVPWEKLRAFKTKARVRLILCVGGWDRSSGFSSIVASEGRRSAFVKAAVRLCLEERLDGLDLDWEHPKAASEQEGYGKLLADLRAGFRPHGLTLSVTMAAWQKLPAEGFAAVDWVHLMAYDHPGRHATFEDAEADVKALLDAKVPAEKVVLGLPFYGRHSKKPEQTLTYREIVARHRPGDDVDEVDQLYFNGPRTVRRKTEFARTSHLGGVMVWELGQDAPGERSLLRTIREAVDRPRK